MARHTFGGDPRRMSDMFECMVNHLYVTFYNKVSGTSLNQWLPRHLLTCRRLIHDTLSDGAVFETEHVDGVEVNAHWILHYFDFSSFRIFGFLDDFALPTARPSSGAFRHDIQRAFYSGYFKKHGLKAQVVWLPIGVIGSVFITSIRQNDNGVQNISGLNDYLVELLHGNLVGGLYPALFTDGIFALLACILPRFRNPTAVLDLLNSRLLGLRESTEHIFADHHVRFHLFSVPEYLMLYRDGVKVRRMAMTSFFMLNCYYCLNGSRSRFFGQVPPTLEDYIPESEILNPPPAVKLGHIWDYGSLSNRREDGRENGADAELGEMDSLDGNIDTNGDEGVA
jgi:hypothetical protein